MIDINLEITGSNKSDINQNFDKIIEIIENSRKDAFKSVNRELINMYWEIGKYVSGKVSKNEWGKSVVKELSDFIQRKNEGIKGFSSVLPEFACSFRQRLFLQTHLQTRLQALQYSQLRFLLSS